MKYEPNYNSRDLAEVLAGDKMRALVQSKAEEGATLYFLEAPKASGHMSTSARAYTEFGGVNGDRWIGIVEVDGGDVPYVGWNEFGTQNQVGSGALQRVADKLDDFGGRP